MKKKIIIGFGVVALLGSAFLVTEKVSPVSWGFWGTYNTTSEVALRGHDAVAYFTSGQPTQGEDQFTYEWGGARWAFASDANRTLFAANPDAYAPQFGGFCAFAVSKGFTADISPDAWHIEDGKLYVFADTKVREDWVSGINEGSLDASTRHWAKR